MPIDPIASPTRASPISSDYEESPSSERGRALLTLSFSSLFESDVVSDVILDLEAAGGETAALPAHRVVLVAGSTYFVSMFSSAWEQQASSGTAQRRVRVLSEERLAHLRLFFAFLYGVEIDLDFTCAHPLLRLADFYGVDALMTQCLRFLERTLHPQPTRCFSLFESESASGSPLAPALVAVPPQERLIALCSEVLARSFAEASAHASFVRCPFELLAAVLERDDLSVDKEDEVLASLLAWADHDPARRGGNPLVKLLNLVRWPLMEGSLLAEIEESHPLLSERSQPQAANALCTLLLEAFKYQATSEERRSASLSCF